VADDAAAAPPGDVSSGASAVAPTARRMRDRAAVVSAREEIVGALLHARVSAVARGASELTVSARPRRVTVVSDGDTVRDVLIGDGLGVDVVLSGGRDTTVLRFDPLGLGRFTNTTIRLRRGDAESAVIVSGYGRVRRR